MSSAAETSGLWADVVYVRDQISPLGSKRHGVTCSKRCGVHLSCRVHSGGSGHRITNARGKQGAMSAWGCGACHPWGIWHRIAPFILKTKEVQKNVKDRFRWKTSKIVFVTGVLGSIIRMNGLFQWNLFFACPLLLLLHQSNHNSFLPIITA